MGVETNTDQGLSGPSTLESGGNRREGLVGGKDSGDVGAIILASTRPSTPAPRERGLIEKMEEEARETGLRGVRATLPPSTLFADRALLRRGYSISTPNALVETISKYKGLH